MDAPHYETEFILYPYKRSADQDRKGPVRHKIVIVGGGPVGMATALDLGRKGVPVMLLDDHDGVGQGSRAICFAKRTLEIADRLGCGDAMVEKGVVWNLGRVFRGDRQIYEFNLLPEDGHHRPAFINLQQPYFEKFLHEGILHAQNMGAPIEIRGRNQVTSLVANSDYCQLEVDTPDGPYRMEAEWVVACDGAHSPIREMLGLDFSGRVFHDNFLIADVKMSAEFPTERRFWFEPSFKGSGQSALLHKQPDNIWRMDFQLGWDIDREKELKEENVRARVDAMLGDQIRYKLVWTSIYTFQCRRMNRFRHGRVLFAGDSAHQVSPFGARGANSGIQDSDNLSWKLHLVEKGMAPDALLDTYSSERVQAAEDNVVNSTRSTDFITPKSEMSRIFRNAVLDLSERFAFARPLVNSGRLSVPCNYDTSPLNWPDTSGLPERTRPGSPAPDAPLESGNWLLERLGERFQILAINNKIPVDPGDFPIPVEIIHITGNLNTALIERYLGNSTSAVYLLRPDQHIAARWVSWEATEVQKALATALGFTLGVNL